MAVTSKRPWCRITSPLINGFRSASDTVRAENLFGKVDMGIRRSGDETFIAGSSVPGHAGADRGGLPGWHDPAEGAGGTATADVRSGLRRTRRRAVPAERPDHRGTAGAAHDRSGAEQGERGTAALLGNAVRRVGARPRGGGRRRLHPGLRAARAGQRAQEDLPFGDHAGPVCDQVRREDPRLHGPPPRSGQRRPAADAGVLRGILRPLLGPAPRCQGRGHPGRGAAARHQLHQRDRPLVPDLGHRP